MTTRFYRGECGPVPSTMEELVDAIEKIIPCREGPMGKYFAEGKEYKYVTSSGYCVNSNAELKGLARAVPICLTEEDAVRCYWYYFNQQYADIVVPAVRQDERHLCVLYWREYPSLEWYFGRATIISRHYIDGPFRPVIRIDITEDDLRRAVHPISVIDGGKQ